MSTDLRFEDLRFEEFERCLLETVRILRQEFAAQDRTYITFRVDARGRTHDGDLKVEFSLREQYSDTEVVGGRLSAVLEEYSRRTNWTALNAPLCLPTVAESKVPVPELDDSIPF